MAKAESAVKEASKKPNLPQPPKPVHTWPYLVQIEMVAALAYILALSLMAAFVNAPLLGLANPEVTPNPAKAPWYFLGLQELLLHMHPALAGVIVPTVVLVGLAAIPYVDVRRAGTGVWFSPKKGVPIAVFSFVYTVVWELALILIDEFLNVGEGQRGIAAFLKTVVGTPAWFAEIVVPSFLMLLIPTLLVLIVKRRWQANTREVMIALFTFFLASFILLTLIGTAFRGASMRLVWPWQLTGPTEH